MMLEYVYLSLMCYFNQIVKHFETLFWKVRYKVITIISYGRPTKQWKEMYILKIQCFFCIGLRFLSYDLR